MKHPRHPFVLALLAALGLASACDTDVPIDDEGAIAPHGVIRGTVLYQGPVPCTRAGHVVGNAIVLVFDAKNPPPPAGIATTAVNFGVVTGDVLFANLPRTAGETAVCPDPSSLTTIAASAPFAIAPLDPAQYIVQAFFDTTGDFLPEFKFRNLPEKGDVGGGYLDTADALAHAGDPNYRPVFLPVTVGVPKPPTAPPDAPDFTMPPQGYLADDVPVTLGSVLALPRPYFHADGAEGAASAAAPTPTNPSGNPNFVPVVTVPQDVHILAPPAAKLPSTVDAFQGAFPQIKIDANLPAAEQAAGVDPLQPFHLQASPGLFVWKTGTLIPEGNGVPALYPQVVFTKLVDDPTGAIDPQQITAQGSTTAPFVVIQGITLFGDSLLDTVLTDPAPAAPDPTKVLDHFTVLIRPSALCFDPRHVDQGGQLVTPYAKGPSADPNEAVPPEGKDLADLPSVIVALGKLVKPVPKLGCLPLGRYAINVVYPTGQAWTTPNEAGSCAPDEGGATLPAGASLLACTRKPRNVLYSQGTRAVVEVVPPSTPEGVAYCQAHPVPAECLKNP